MQIFVDPYDIKRAIRDGYRTTINVGGSVLFSAGTLSSLRSDISFNNGGGISFGLDAAGIITASVAPGAGAGTGFTTATTPGSNIVGTLGAGGLSMGIPAYLTTAQPPGAYLTTAMASNRGSDFVQATANFFGTNASGTISSNAISISVAAPGGGGSLNISAGTTSSNVSAVTFSNGSGVLFGFDGSNITASVRTNYAGTGFSTSATTGSNLVVASVDTNGIQLGLPPWLTTTPLPGAGTGFTTATTAGTNIVGTLDTNGLSMGVPAYLTNATAAFPRLDQVLDPNTDKVFNMGTDQVQFQYAGGGTFSTNATRQGLFELDFLGNAGAGAHGLHVLQSVGNQVDMHLVHIEGHDTNVLPFHIEGSHSNNMWLNQPINFTTDETAFPIGSVPFIMGTQMSNMVSNLNADYVDGRDGSVLAGTGFTTATTAGTAVVGTLGTDGLSLGVPAFATSSGAAPVAVTLSQFNNLPLFPANVVIQQTTASQVVIVPFTLPQPISCSFVRFFISAPWQQPSAVSGTSVNTSWNLNRSYTFPIVILTQGQGASSNSLMYSTSTYCTFVNSIVVTAGAVGSNYTVSMTANFPQSGATTGTFATAIATTSASYVLPTGVFTSVAGLRMLDIPFPLSLNAGNYWMQIAGFSTDSAGNGPGNYTSASMIPFNWYAAPQAISTWNPFGSASSNSNCFPFGLGSWSTNSALMSTSNINVTAISAFTDGRMIYFQMLRRA